MPDELRTTTPPVPAPILDALRTLVAPLGVLRDAEMLTGGMFATTYRVTFTDGERVIVKTAPAGSDQLLTYEHDVLRTEALVYQLAAADPTLLMPRVLLTDFTRTLLPTDAVVVTHVTGVPVAEATDLDDDAHRRRERELGALMARLHTLTGPRFGYPAVDALQGSTWPEAFGAMVEAALVDGERWGTPLPADEIRAALARHSAALAEVTTPALVHADLWPGNLFVDPQTGALTGLIDPERAFWGDPLFEFVGADPFSDGPPPNTMVEGYEGAGGRTGLDAPGGTVRMELCRMYMALVMLAEIRPRRYEGDWLPGHLASVEGHMRVALDALAR